MPVDPQTAPRHYCEGCHTWHDGLWCPTPRVPEFQPAEGWLEAEIKRATIGSVESRLDAEQQRIIALMVRGEATEDDRRRLWLVQQERAERLHARY